MPSRKEKRPPEPFHPITRFDWDFRSVVDDELIACCLWEYARESHSLAFAREHHRITMRRISHNKSWGGLPADDNAFEKHIADLGTREKHARFDYEAFLGRYWESDVGYVRYYQSLREYGGFGTRPWRRLMPKIRRRFVRELEDRSIFKPMELASVQDLERLWLANNQQLLKVRAQPRDPGDDSEDAALYSPTATVPVGDDNAEQPARQMAAALAIDFSRFSDTEIMTAFSAWLRTNRPKRWRTPRNIFPAARRGKKLNDYRVALERLALMRLLHWYTPGFLRNELPEAWRIYGRKESVFRRELRAALAFFRERFPFISKSEMPSSYPRYNTWIRPFLRSLDGGRKSPVIR